jgi:YHS domain-containing protein
MMIQSIFGTLRGAAIGFLMVLGATMASADTKGPLNQTADGIAMDGFDVVAYFADAKAAKGDAAFGVDYEGARWLFSSQDNADAFSADPAHYAPKNNGWCSYAVSEGYGAEVDFVNGWSVVDDALYLNWDKSTRDLFLAEQAKRIPASAANWPTVSAGLADGSVELYRHADDASVGIAHPQQLE